MTIHSRLAYWTLDSISRVLSDIRWDNVLRDAVGCGGFGKKLRVAGLLETVE